MSVNLKSLISRLNDPTRKALEAAAGLCVSRTHYDIEIEHVLMKLLDDSNGDLARILERFEIDSSRLSKSLTRALDGFKTGNARTPAFSPSVVDMFSQAWMVATLNFGVGQVRSGHCILALLESKELTRLIETSAPELLRIGASTLAAEFEDVVEDSLETAAGPIGEDGAAAPTSAKAAAGENLKQFTVDLTEAARAGKIDPVLGRDPEIRQIVDILMRRRQNNPILTGEAGVGKTAVVEGFALRIAKGDVPPPLKNVSVRSLDLALLQAGAGVKGEFENRLKGLIEEVKASETPIILFIDEAHTLIGAGGQEGQGDAANLLKPALARGELRTVAATTWSEYKKYFEKDPALSRRFQVVKVEEPDVARCLVMLRGITPHMERHHNVRILDSAVEAAVKLSQRYLAGRQLPDKAVSILDTASARVALGHHATPGPIEDSTRIIDDLEVQQRVLEREQTTGADHAERLVEIKAALEKERAHLGALEQRFETEKKLVERVRELREMLEGGDAPEGEDKPDPAAMREELRKLDEELTRMQGETPLLRVCVDEQVIGEVLSAWTGIPVGKMLKDEMKTILDLAGILQKRVIGQDHAMEALAQRIQTSRASLDDPNRPVGVFLLVGPSGVGKTESALALSDLLYGGERNLITINMSEFQEAHTVSTLKGSPPGYVGYGEGGVLTEAVRRRPYSVVLLDEIEKAHPDVMELFYQVFDKGMMEDGEGREIDFKNTVIILTSNAATEQLMQLTADPETMPAPSGLVKAIKPELDKVFKPAFLGRLVIVPYFPVRDEALKQIIRLKMNKIVRRLGENHRIELVYDETLVDTVSERCTEVESGARNIDNILTNTLLPLLSRQLLGQMAEGVKADRVTIGIGEKGEFTLT
ncbi:MAG: type VI secretion system ATPase TssH [Bryobacterales bacterium]|nr:type VI secretion system ATPase TssH [Acidobacteriota bacterium]MCB9385572.1 type VI secretion system ATPase TssH [Bryobacterales bacterium]